MQWDFTCLLNWRKAFSEAIVTKDTVDTPTSEILGLDSIRCEALYARDDGVKQIVWVEWKDYESRPSGYPCPSTLIADRVEKLATLLQHRPKPDNFRVPHCLGYFDNATHEIDESTGSYIDDQVDYRIGLVFEKPDEIEHKTKPISLLELLRTVPKPSVTDRITLAQAIANCILYLHAVDWLHNGLRSHNIIFFMSAGLEKIDYSKSYLSGFDLARPARREEQTETPGDNAEYNMYSHSKAHSQGSGPHEKFRKSFDVYSLGVVLVELAHWMSVDKVLGFDIKALKGKGRIAKRVRSSLLKETSIEALGANMGNAYQAVVKCY